MPMPLPQPLTDPTDTPAKPTVRAATATDLPLLVEFNAAMALETEAKTLITATLTAGVNAVLNDSALGFYRVALAPDGEVAGSLMVTFEWSDWRNAQFFWIQSVYVRPQYRRLGVFRALYHDVQQLARAQGACGIRLYAEVHNARAHRTYRELGMSDGHYAVFEEPLG
jgi:GNAT superfamily N-acetyltransferase